MNDITNIINKPVNIYDITYKGSGKWRLRGGRLRPQVGQH